MSLFGGGNLELGCGATIRLHLLATEPTIALQIGESFADSRTELAQGDLPPIAHGAKTWPHFFLGGVGGLRQGILQSFPIDRDSGIIQATHGDMVFLDVRSATTA